VSGCDVSLAPSSPSGQAPTCEPRQRERARNDDERGGSAVVEDVVAKVHAGDDGHQPDAEAAADTDRVLSGPGGQPADREGDQERCCGLEHPGDAAAGVVLLTADRDEGEVVQLSSGLTNVLFEFAFLAAFPALEAHALPRERGDEHGE